MKQKLQGLDVPPPSDEARERALQAAMQAFDAHQEKTRKGFTDTVRPIRTTASWQHWIRRLNMQKAYVFAGSFAAVAVVLAITTTHYSTIMAPQMPQPEPAVVQSEEGKTEATSEVVVDMTAPGMPQSASPPAQPAPGLAAGMPSEDPAKVAPNRNAKDLSSREVFPEATAPKSMPGKKAQAPGMVAGSAPPQEAAKSKRVMNASDVAEMHGVDVADVVGDGLTMTRDLESLVKAVPGKEAQALGRRVPAPGMPPNIQHDRVLPDPQPVIGGDKFESYQANAAKVTAQEPVSTFSIDVDTASYSFVRRMLNSGSLPQPEMVRVEEMINYFGYDYARPESKAEPFKPTIAVYPTPWNKDTRLVHIGIKGYDIANAQKPPTNLVFLIDVSGSMNSADKLPLVKTSLHMLVDQMDEDDTIGIVTYAGYAGTALEPTSGANKKQIRAVINQLGAGGGTAGSQGIEQAYYLAQNHFVKDGVNRVILATDGDFNVGISDPAALQNFIEQKRQTGIFLSVLGFGQGNYNDALMQKLAQHGNGNAAYIDNINEARKVLVNEAGATLFAIAKDVKLQVEWNPALVSSYRLIGYESRLLNREDFNDDKVDAGEVGAGHAVTAIYEIRPVGAGVSADDLRYGQVAPPTEKASGNFRGEYGFLKIRYKLPEASESILITAPIAKAQETASIDQVSTDIRFAAAVAAFGQMLRGEPATSGMTFDQVITLADGARGKDTLGYRAEFVALIGQARALATSPTMPMPSPLD